MTGLNYNSLETNKLKLALTNFSRSKKKLPKKFNLGGGKVATFSSGMSLGRNFSLPRIPDQPWQVLIRSSADRSSRTLAETFRDELSLNFGGFELHRRFSMSLSFDRVAVKTYVSLLSLPN